MSTKSPVGEQSEIEVLKAQIAELTKLVLAQSASKQEEPKRKEKPVRIAKQEKSKELAPNTYVNVMSLVNNPLNLSTKPRGQGKNFRFETFGTVKRMFYSELLDVIENHPNFFEKGYFYVLDNQVIEMNNYVDLYKKLLTKEMMESIINNTPNAISLFEGAAESQRSIIVEFFVSKIVDGQAVDFNLIANINRIASIDIQKMANDRKEALSMLDNKSENK
jgi:hypothetical protein